MKSTYASLGIIVFFLTFAWFPVHAFGQQSVTPITATTNTATESSVSAAPVITMENTEIQYDLPYPGLLPDSPLYFLKIIRDKIEEFFITDPLQKANYDVSQADKRMNATIYLSEESSVKPALISATLSKALNYFEQGITDIRQARKEGEDVDSFVAHMDTAAQKYHQLVLQLETKTKNQLRGDLEGDKTRIDTLRRAVVAMGKK